MRVRHADLRIGHAAELVAEHQGDDARQIALVGQHLQIEHQLDVVVTRRRDAGRMIDDRQILVVLLFGELNPPLHVANRVEILGELRAVALPKRALQMRDLLALRNRGRSAARWMRASRAFGSVLPLSPNRRSNTTRGLFCANRGVLALFQEIVLVYAQAKPMSQAPAVSPDSMASSSEASCVCLPVSCARIWSTEIAGIEPRFTGGRRDVREEPRAGFGVRAARPPGRRNTGKIAQHQKLIAIGRKRAQRRRQFVCRAFEHRRPLLHDHAVRHVHDTEAVDRFGGLRLQKQTTPAPCRPATATPGRAHAAQNLAS